MGGNTSYDNNGENNEEMLEMDIIEEFAALYDNDPEL